MTVDTGTFEAKADTLIAKAHAATDNSGGVSGELRDAMADLCTAEASGQLDADTAARISRGLQAAQERINSLMNTKKAVQKKPKEERPARPTNANRDYRNFSQANTAFQDASIAFSTASNSSQQSVMLDAVAELITVLRSIPDSVLADRNVIAAWVKRVERTQDIYIDNVVTEKIAELQSLRAEAESVAQSSDKDTWIGFGLRVYKRRSL